MQPIGEYEEINGFLGGEVTVELKRLNLPYFIPKQALIKVPVRSRRGLCAGECEVVLIIRPLAKITRTGSSAHPTRVIFSCGMGRRARLINL